jgi:protein arginine kinase
MSNIVKTNEIMKPQVELKEMFINFRLMLVRNYEKLPFVSAMSEECRTEFEDDFVSFITRKKRNLVVTNIDSLNKEKRLMLYNRGLWLKELENEKNITYIYSGSFDFAIIINYKNHITILSATNQPVFKNAYKRLTELGEKISEFARVNANERYGYVSPVLKDCGLGFKITALMHIMWVRNFNFLASENKEAANTFEKVQDDLFNRGYLLEKSFFEKLDCDDFCEISSRFNYGVTEQDLMERFVEGLKSFLEQEQEAIHLAMKEIPEIMQDMAYRSLGVMKYARILGLNEAIRHCANLRIGIKIKLPIDVDLELLNQLQSAIFNFYLPDENNDVPAKRAELVRLLLKGDNNAK